MNTPLAAIVGLGLSLPGLPAPGVPHWDAWRAGTRDADATPTGEIIEKRSRRRSSPLTKALADAYAEALHQSALPGAEVASVFGSALGEASTMIGLLDTMWREGGPLSPMAFAMSVHNAASGVVSISTENRGYATSLGADFDTPAMCLVEALGLLASGHKAVVIACGDEGVPAELVRGGAGWHMVAGAIALVPAADAPPSALRVSHPFNARATLDAADAREAECALEVEVERGIALNPCMGVLDLIHAAHRAQPCVVRLDRGHGQGWAVELSRVS